MPATFRGLPACPCLIAWLPAYERELLRRGVIRHSIDISKLVDAGSRTHRTGGVFDIAQTQTRAVRVARQMGADATWHRQQGWDGGAGKEHTHGVLRGCPHNEPARYQLDAVDAGFDGLGTAGRAGPDDGPRPLARRTWEQGIVWARTQQAVETVVRVDELSGRYDRDPALLAAQLAGSAAEADVILVTEVSAARRASALRMDGWTVSRGPDGDRGEVAVLTRDAIWTVRAYAAAVLGPDLGPGGKVVSGIALLEHTGTGARFAPSIAHLPASVEGTWARGRGRADAYRAAVDEWRLLHVEWRRRHQPDAEAAFADWNLNLHRRWVRDWVGDAWPTLTLPPAAVIPAGATHAGGRLIDWFVRRGLDVDTWGVLPSSPASDHRGIRVRARVMAQR